MRVIEIVEVLLARMASSRITVGKLRVDVFLDRLVLGDGLDHHVAVGEDLVEVDVFRERARLSRSSGVARPILIRLMTTSAARLQAVGHPGVVDVDHHGRNPRASVRRGDARPHLPGPQHADPLHGSRL